MPWGLVITEDGEWLPLDRLDDLRRLAVELKNCLRDTRRWERHKGTLGDLWKLRYLQSFHNVDDDNVNSR
jgi:hypothetical protein